MTEWQPIETVPKDGTIVLFWPDFYAEDSRPPSQRKEQKNRYVAMGWTSGSGDYWSPEMKLLGDPTHWMPLPAPPNEGDKE
jgi:hypothetical protein